MGNKNSTNYTPNQIVNHLRQQYPEMNNKQLQELYTRWYLRNSQNTQTTQHSTVLSDNDRYHLSNIYNLIETQHTQTPYHTQYQNNSQNFSHSQGDRLPTQHNYRNSESNLGERYHQTSLQRNFEQKPSGGYQPRNISEFQQAPSRSELEVQFQNRVESQNPFRSHRESSNVSQGGRSNVVFPNRQRPHQNYSQNLHTQNSQSGNSSQNTQESHKKKQLREDLSTINPTDAYRLFGLQPDFTVDQLKKAYRKLSLQTHPDRGGSSEKFKFVTRHYLFLVEEYQKNKPSLSFNDLRQSSRDYVDQQQQNPRQNIYMDNDSSQSGSNFDNQRFNELYTQNRLSTVHDEGYSNWIEDNAMLEDKDPEPLFSDKFNLNVFNNLFENDKDKNPQSQVIVYTDPVPTNISRETSYSEIGEDTIGDFSGEAQSGLGYTDYKKAHTQTRLINVNQVKSRESYKNVEHLQSQRDQISFKMSPEDQRKHDEKLKHEKWLESERVKRVQRQDIHSQDHFEKVNQLMIGLR